MSIRVDRRAIASVIKAAKSLHHKRQEDDTRIRAVVLTEDGRLQAFSDDKALGVSALVAAAGITQHLRPYSAEGLLEPGMYERDDLEAWAGRKASTDVLEPLTEPEIDGRGHGHLVQAYPVLMRPIAEDWEPPAKTEPEPPEVKFPLRAVSALTRVLCVPNASGTSPTAVVGINTAWIREPKRGRWQLALWSGRGDELRAIAAPVRGDIPAKHDNDNTEGKTS